MADPLSLAASLITIVATLRGGYVCMRAVEKAPRKARTERRQLRDLYHTIEDIAKGLNNGTLSACERTCSQVSACLEKADRLLTKFHKSTAFLRIKSKNWAKVGRIECIGRAIRTLCGKLRFCCTNTKAIIYEMERLSRRVSKLELKEKPKPAQEKPEPRGRPQSREGSEPAQEKPEQPREHKQRTKRTPQKPKKHKQRNKKAWIVGGIVIGAIVGAAIGSYVGNGWGGVALGAVVGGVVGGFLGSWFSS